MRVLMLTDLYPPQSGGAELYVQRLSRQLVRRGHEVAVVTFSDRGTAHAGPGDGVRIFRIRGLPQSVDWLYSDTGRRFSPPFPDPVVVHQLIDLVGRDRWNIVHAHNWLVHSFLPLKKRSGAALVLTLHDYSLVCARKSLMHEGGVCSGPRLAKCVRCASRFFGPVRGVPTVIGQWAMAPFARDGVDIFLPVSNAVASHTGLATQRLPFEVIPNFTDDDALPEGAGIGQLPTQDFVLYVGELSRAKGIEVLLEAYAQLRCPPPLVLIGAKRPDTPARMPPGVTLLGNLPHSTVVAAWRRCLFGVVPSVWPEPCPTVALEAMSASRAVIGSNTGGLPELVVHGETGLLVPPGDVSALRGALQQLLDRPTLASQLGAAGQERVHKFEAEAIVPRIERVYERVSGVSCLAA